MTVFKLTVFENDFHTTQRTPRCCCDIEWFKPDELACQTRSGENMDNDSIVSFELRGEELFP